MELSPVKKPEPLVACEFILRFDLTQLCQPREDLMVKGVSVIGMGMTVLSDVKCSGRDRHINTHPSLREAEESA